MPKGKERKAIEAVTRDYTINLHKRLHKRTFKQRAPRAMREIAEFAKANMMTNVSFTPFYFFDKIDDREKLCE